MTLTIDEMLLLWGKTSRASTEVFHPAIYHMLDAGHVAQVLLAEGSCRWCAVLAENLACDHETVQSLTPWLVALHDLGKMSQAFQRIVPDQKKRLEQAGIPFSRRKMTALHTILAAADWPSLSITPIGQLPELLREALYQTVAGHHGFWLRANQAPRCARQMHYVEDGFWKSSRQAAVQWLWEQFSPALPVSDITDLSAAIMALSGFTILCDWLASDERFFLPTSDLPSQEYKTLSMRRAQEAVSRAGFLQPAASAAPTAFSQVFGKIATPRPLQNAIDDIPSEILGKPVLAFVEAPTGEGKTEAALALAHRIGALRGTDAIYYALPTMATSNSMFGRVNQHLKENLALGTENRLVHSQAFLLQDDAEPRPMRNGEKDGEAMRSWFAPLKKALLAPFGVGTIDQAELAVLNVRHVALRCVGLAGKVVILDEVHAYDVYVSTIIERMLTWLHSLGSSVIVLSATLPDARRRALSKAWGSDLEPSIELPAYPRIEVISDTGRHVAYPATAQEGRKVNLEWLSLAEDDAAEKAAWLLEQVTHGGCACWITNTVAQAQALFACLQEMTPHDLPLDLIHSRFPVAQRQVIEKQIIDRYGVKSSGIRRGIVIGTQVLEQSLDLDFDLMVSDLAPVDLLLQRAGRLHRHTRPERPVSEAKLWINLARDEHGEPELGVNAVIYAEYILRRTLAALAGRTAMHLPADYRALIEAVYVEGEPEDDALRPSWDAYVNESYQARQEAEQRLLPEPWPDEPFCTKAATLLFQENEDGASWSVAQTRLAAESVTLVPLERDGSAVRLVSAELTLPANKQAEREAALTILRHAIRVSHSEVVRLTKSTDENRLPLLKHPLLRNVHPLWLQDGVAHLDRIDLRLDQALGLVIDYGERGETM